MSNVSGNEETLTRDAIESMEKCYKSVGVSALIDVADFLYHAKQQDLFSLASRIDLMRISTKVAFFSGLFLSGRLVKNLPATSASEDSIIKALDIMKNLWLFTAIFVVFGSGLNASRLLSLSERDRLVATCCVLLAMAVRVFSLKDMKQLSAVSALQDRGNRTLRSMSFCASALILHGSVKLWDSWSTPALLARTLRLIGSPTPFRVALRLAALRRALAEALSAWPEYNQVRDKLAKAQVSFYSKVGDTFRDEVILKVVIVAVALVKKFLLQRT